MVRKTGGHMRVKNNGSNGMSRQYADADISEVAHCLEYAKAMFDLFGHLGESSSIVDNSNLMVLSIEAKEKIEDALEILKV